MKSLLSISIFLIFCIHTLSAQDNWEPFKCQLSPQTYVSCAAIFYHGKSLVDSFSPDGKCEISQNFDGYISLFSVELEHEDVKPLVELDFQVAIHNKRTNTYRMFSSKVYKQIRLDDILRELEDDDSIIIMTTDKHYSLPHHEITINSKC